MIHGSCASRFVGVQQAFEANFAQRGELGASACVIVDGEVVLDLWGGLADHESGRAWERDTIGVIMSATKGAAALCAHMLADSGELELDAPIAACWPEFAARGKDAITLRHVLTHQSGVWHVAPPVPEDGFFDWPAMVGLVEQTAPFWAPGTRTGYHAHTFGYIVGEVVRRTTGRSIGTFFCDEVAGPLGLDFWIGLPAEHEPRVARGVSWDPAEAPLPPSAQAVVDDPHCMQSLAGNDGGWLARSWDTPDAHAAELPAAGGITNGRGLAGMYAAIPDLVRPVTLAAMRATQSATDVDAYLLTRTAFSVGFAKSWPNRDVPGNNSVILGEDAFGAPGGGGHVGFYDPSMRLAFGYTMTRMGFGVGLNTRGQELIDATYRALGSPTSAPGFWVRPS